MTKCPHCAYENWPWATHCAGCLKDLNPAPTPPPEAAPKEEPAAVPKSLRPTIPSPAGWLGAAVAVILGVVLLAQFGQWLSRQEPPPAQARTDTPVQPVSPPAPVTTTPAATPTTSEPAPPVTPPPPPPIAEEEDRAPEIQYKVAMSWLQRKNPDRARKAFEEVLVKYPSSRFAQEAQVQLDQLHAPKTAVREPFSNVVDEDPAPQLQYRVAMNWVTRNNPAKARQAFEELLRKYPTSRYAGDARAQLARLPVSEAPAAKAPPVDTRSEPTAPSPPGTFTNADVQRLAAGAARAASGETPAKQAVLPALGDSLTLLSSEISGGQMILRLRYRLAIGRTRSVHAAVRVVFPEPHPPVFVYSPETVQGGAGETTVRVPLAQQLISIKPVGARLMLFESNGPMFYSHDVPWPQ